MTPILGVSWRSRTQCLFPPSNGYHDTSIEMLWQGNATGSIIPVLCLKIETLSLYHLSQTRKDSYSAYVGWEKAAGPRCSIWRQKLDWPILQFEWIHKWYGISFLLSKQQAQRRTGRARETQSYSSVGQQRKRGKRKRHFLLQKFRSLWSSALHNYRNHSSYNSS